MKKLLAVAAFAAVFLCGCHHGETPEIITKDVNIAVPVPCTVDTHKQRPELLTLVQLQQKLDAAPNTDTKAQIITNQLLAYMGWLPVVESAMQGCEMAQKAKNP